MKRFSLLVAVSSVVGALAFGAIGARAEDAKCGEKGQPSCPLQGWMEKNVDAPMSAKDLAKVAAALEKVATMSPDPKWNEGANSWSKIAKDGAAAAKAGDAAAAGASCKSCHKAWRKEYKEKHRTRPVS